MFTGTEKDAVKNAEAALSAMKEQNIPPTPANFTVWYAYLAGVEPDLNRSIDALTEGGEPLNAEQCAEIYSTFFDGNHSDPAVDRTADALLGEIRGILDQVNEVSDETGAYGESLDVFAQVLKEDDKGVFKPAIDTILQATTLISDKNRALESRLTHSTTEISRLQEDLEHLRQEAMTDALTGIANRRQFDKVLTVSSEEAVNNGAPLSLIMIDIDHFKKFNDTHGRQIGDQVLKLLANVLLDTVKGQDTPARYGGEEFAIILPDTGLDGAASLANTIRERICRKRMVNRTNGEDLGKITVSAGATTFHAGESIEDFVARADEALYLAKRSGRDRVMASQRAA